MFRVLYNNAKNLFAEKMLVMCIAYLKVTAEKFILNGALYAG